MRFHLPRVLALAAALAPAAAAQGTCAFTIDQPASGFTWTGTSVLGPLQGVPGNSFELAGGADIDLSLAGTPYSTGAFVGGTVSMVGGLHGEVPNPLIGFPALATFDATNLTADVQSSVFHADGAGGFTADFVLTMESGNIAVTSLAGMQNIPLAGLVTNPAMATGSLVQGATDHELTLPISMTLPFSDSTGTLTGSFTLSGTIQATAPLATACGRTLIASPRTISLEDGGDHKMGVDVGAAHAGDLYWIFGSLSGTSPGLAGPPAVPLNPDAYMQYTVDNPNDLISNSIGFLDGAGQAEASWDLPAGDLGPSFQGQVIHHACVVFDGSLTPLAATNAVELTLVP
jgi:hypothetical protein